MLYGSKYSATEAPTALALYCPYILLLAANGILECFVQAVSRGPELKYGHFALIGITAIQAAATLKLVASHGTLGMIASDALGMLLRIVYCAIFVGVYARKSKPGGSLSLWQAVPSIPTLAALAIASLVSGLSLGVYFDRGWLAGVIPSGRASFLGAAFWHISINFALLSACLAVMYRTERSILMSIRGSHGKKYS